MYGCIVNSVSRMQVPVPVAARSKAWVCGRSPDEIVGSNPTGGMDVCLLSGTGFCDKPITVQSSLTESGVSLCVI